MHMTETVPGCNGEVCVFKTTLGERFSIAKPAMNKAQEAALIDVLREILEEEGEI